MVALNHHPEEIKERFPEGAYDFEITYVDTDWVSKAGNAGICAHMNFWHEEGTSFTRMEYLVTSLPSCAWKLRQFCSAIGLDYEDANLDTDQFLDKKGKAMLVRKQESIGRGKDREFSVDAEGKPILEKYLSVDTYLVHDGEEPTKQEADVPF